MKPAIKIWALDDGIPGHWSMTEGLARLFAKTRDVEVTRIRVTWKWGSVRHVFQRMNRLGLPVPTWWVRAAARLDPAPDLSAAASPDLVVSRGGATLFLNAWLARRAGCKNVFIGKLRQMQPSHYSAVILRQDQQLAPPFFPLPMLPTRIDPTALDEQAATFPWTHRRPTGRVATLLIGGDGSGYAYRDTDWTALAEGMASYAREYGVRWCVTTSRRTPSEVESRILATVPGEAVAESCWWHRGDRRPCMAAFLAVSEQVFCTEDSMSMLEEVIASGRPLIALSPEIAQPNPAFSGFLALRINGGRMVRNPLSDFAKAITSYPIGNDWKLMPPDAMESGTRELLALLDL